MHNCKKFGQHKHKFWGYGYNDLCYTGNTHDIIIFNFRARPILRTPLTNVLYHTSACPSAPPVLKPRNTDCDAQPSETGQDQNQQNIYRYE